MPIQSKGTTGGDSAPSVAPFGVDETTTRSAVRTSLVSYRYLEVVAALAAPQVAAKIANGTMNPTTNRSR